MTGIVVRRSVRRSAATLRPFSVIVSRRFADKPVHEKPPVKGLRPMILDENPPAEKDQPEDVKQHNREMDQRADRAEQRVSVEDAKTDKVPKGYWSGTGGVQQGPEGKKTQT